MVAYTTPDCLPYFGCDDSPCVNTGSTCEPSTVWCDFAELVDAKLTEFDAVVQRTATSVPMGWVQSTVPSAVISGGSTDPVPVVFDSSVVDTDNMVNLDSLPSSLQVNTAGLYQFVYSAVGVATVAGAATAQLSAALSPFVSLYPFSPPSLVVDFEIPITGIVVTPMISLALPLAAGQTLTMGVNMVGTSAPDNTLFSVITAGLVWLADLP